MLLCWIQTRNTSCCVLVGPVEPSGAGWTNNMFCTCHTQAHAFPFTFNVKEDLVHLTHISEQRTRVFSRDTCRAKWWGLYKIKSERCDLRVTHCFFFKVVFKKPLALFTQTRRIISAVEVEMPTGQTFPFPCPVTLTCKTLYLNE